MMEWCSWDVVVYTAAAALAVSAWMLIGLLMFPRKKPGHDLHRLPSPPAWPIFGHLYILQQPLHRCLHELSQTYGPLFLLKLGTVPTLVVSSPHWAKEFLHAHDRDLVNRPQLEAGKHILYNNSSLTMSKYGPSWRHLRKLYVSHILTTKNFEMFEDARHHEMALLIHSIQCRASIDNGATVDFRNMLFSTLGNMLTMMMFSKRAFDTSEAVDGSGSRFKYLIEEATVLFAAPVLGDVIPWLTWFDGGVKRRMQSVGKEIDAFLEGVVEERIESRSRGVNDAEEASDYLDLLLSLYTEDGKIDKQSIKVILLDLLATGTETTATTIEWTMAELLNNPSCMKKLQEEVDMASEEKNRQALRDADLAKLSYLQAVIKESLRFHPAVTLNFRAFSDALEQGIQVGGFHLPNNTRVLVNVWALGRDPTLWGDDAHTFSPERFLPHNSAPDVRGQNNFQFLPFGTGRRGCPGMNFALTAIPFIVANLVQAVNWSIPNGVPLDLSESAAFTTPMAKHLVAKPSLRTHN